ncbi:MAG TPA: tetratricopeptide repeat protein, partial [bacterium]|nr:tetratricopeptide repeat protein [bacterium]
MWRSLLLVIGLTCLPSAGGTEEGAPSDELGVIRELGARGEFGEADTRVRALLARVDVPGTPAADVAPVLEAAVGLALRLNHADALPMAERLVELRREVGDPTGVASALAHLGQVHHRRGELDEARSLLEESVRRHEEASSPPPVLATALKMAANLHLDLGLDETAERELERALELDADADPVARAGTYYTLGRLHDGRERYTRARAAYERGVALLGDSDHLLVAYLRNAIAIIRWELDDFAGARGEFERAIAVAGPHLGADHPFVRGCRRNLALVALKVGDFTGAEAALREELDLLRRTPDHDPEGLAKTLQNLADARVALGRLDEATADMEEALRIRRDVFGADHDLTAGTLHRLALVDLEADRVERALERLEAFVAWRRARGPASVLTGEALTDLGRARMRAGDLKGARSALEEAIDVFRSTVGLNNPRVATALERLAEVDLRSGRFTIAVDRALAAERIAQTHTALTVSFLAEREALLLADVRTR